MKVVVSPAADRAAGDVRLLDAAAGCLRQRRRTRWPYTSIYHVLLRKQVAAALSAAVTLTNSQATASNLQGQASL